MSDRTAPLSLGDYSGPVRLDEHDIHSRNGVTRPTHKYYRPLPPIRRAVDIRVVIRAPLKFVWVC